MTKRFLMSRIPPMKAFRLDIKQIVDDQPEFLMTNPRPEPRTQFVRKTWQNVNDLDLL